jgi:hypothetical protein
MRRWFQDIDSLLRGGFTGSEELAEGRLRVPASKLAVLGLVMGAVYGVFMGLYGVLRPEHPSFAQLLATMLKVPLLFLLTLVVTFPSLYVFSALANSRLRFYDTLKLLLAAVAVNLALLASFGPVTGFFTLSTTSYPFMVVLNVLVFALAGLVAVAFLLRMLNVVFAPGPKERPPEPAEAKVSTEPGQLRVQRAPQPGRPHLRIFVVWTMIYGVIGAQMGWILRPFIGTPEQPFTLFRQRESNFFEAFFEALGRLLV